LNTSVGRIFPESRHEGKLVDDQLSYGIALSMNSIPRLTRLTPFVGAAFAPSAAFRFVAGFCHIFQGSPEKLSYESPDQAIPHPSRTYRLLFLLLHLSYYFLYLLRLTLLRLDAPSTPAFLFHGSDGLDSRLRLFLDFIVGRAGFGEF
jgi:hypothetical protein